MPVADTEVVLVPVDVAVAVEVLDAEALNVPEAVSEPDIDCVLLLVAVAVAVEVEVPVAVTDDVDVALDVAVAVAVATAAPVRTSTSQRYVVAVRDTEISDTLSPASANTTVVVSATFNPFAEVTVIAPPPSVRRRKTARIPGLVGLASVRVSADAPLVSSHTWRSALARMVPPLPGSVISFGPL